MHTHTHTHTHASYIPFTSQNSLFEKMIYGSSSIYARNWELNLIQFIFPLLRSTRSRRPSLLFLLTHWRRSWMNGCKRTLIFSNKMYTSVSTQGGAHAFSSNLQRNMVYSLNHYIINNKKEKITNNKPASWVRFRTLFASKKISKWCRLSCLSIFSRYDWIIK